MVQDLLQYGSNPNSNYNGSALQGSITCISPLAIIKNSRWKSPIQGKQLLDWFKQRGVFDTDDFSQGVPFSVLDGPLHVTYDGPLDVISLLLSKHVDIDVKDDEDVSPLDILASPEKYHKKFDGLEGDNLVYMDRKEMYLLLN